MNKWDILIWGILLGIVLAIAGYKFLKCRKMKKILKRAKAGEKKAVVFLERAGYRVIEVQSRKKVITTIGGTDHESTVIADLIVRKGFFKYVVEVKNPRSSISYFAQCPPSDDGILFSISAPRSYLFGHGQRKNALSEV